MAENLPLCDPLVRGYIDLCGELEFEHWTEPLGSSADETRKAQVEICGWLSRVSSVHDKQIEAWR